MEIRTIGRFFRYFAKRARSHYARGALYSAGQDRLDLRTGQVYFGRSVAGIWR